MAELTLEESNGYRDGAIPSDPLPASAVPALGPDERVELQAYIAELNVYYTAIKQFHTQEPDEVLQQCSAFLARLTEMRALLQRRGTARANQLRTRELDPLVHDIHKQFDIHSRRLSALELE